MQAAASRSDPLPAAASDARPASRLAFALPHQPRLRRPSIVTLAARSDSTSTAPLDILHDVFGYSAFRGAQAEIVDHLAGGGDALVLMPTGGGKSLCYQVPAIARHRAGNGVAISGLTTIATPLPARCRAIAGT